MSASKLHEWSIVTGHFPKTKMANMSYCRFENTLNDLRDCLEHINDEIESEREYKARVDLIETCKEIIEANEN